MGLLKHEHSGLSNSVCGGCSHCAEALRLRAVKTYCDLWNLQHFFCLIAMLLLLQVTPGRMSVALPGAIIHHRTMAP